MEEHSGQYDLPKFSSPEEELKYLRERVAHKEQQLWQEQTSETKESVISNEVIAYAANATPQTRLEEHMILENPQFETVLAHLSSLPHREKVRELYRVLAEKGVLNAIAIAQAAHNPHIEEDFHRVLVEYVKGGSLVPGLDKERELGKELRMTVYEVTLPFAGAQEGAQSISYREVVNAMERFYVGMIPRDGADVTSYGPITFELVLSNFSNDIVFFITVQEHMKDLFVKQLLGAFPAAKIEETPADFNIFNEFGVATASYAEQSDKFVYPVALLEESEQDPFAIIINSFTSIAREGEGAAIQFVIYPETGNLSGKIKYAIGQIRQGIPAGRATNIPLDATGTIAKTFTEFFHTQLKDQKKDDKPNAREEENGQKAAALMEEKLKSPLVRANLRIVVSSSTRERADSIRTSIEAAFSQFNRPMGGGIKWKRVEKEELDKLVHRFTYREMNSAEAMILNTRELATIYHLPMTLTQKDAPQLKTVKASSAPAPADLPTEGTLLGMNVYRGTAREVRLTKPDRLRHLYTIGQTGTGKSIFIQNMIMQDILAGNGVCFIDPHGKDVQEILSAIPPERIDDVIYFDPTLMARPFALNMLEYDASHPEQKIFVVNEMLSIFKTLYASTPESMGPAFEQYFRNATMLVMEDPETGNTLLEIPRVLADPAFRNLKLSRCKNPIVVQFWRDIATKTSGESGLQNMIPYITNKFDVFISNDVMRPIIAQEKSSFNFRDVMDSKKILLVNLSKGKLGEMNANLLGLIIVGKFLMAAMSRVDSFGKNLPDFYMYIDEFQNISTPSISAILSEARKYGLSLNLAHQFIGQLPEYIKDAVFGNVGNMMVFRVGAEDANFLEKQFAPIFKASDIIKIENYNAYAKILIGGKPTSPFNLKMSPPPEGHPEIVEQMKNLSALKYGRDRKIVDDAIMKRYMAGQNQQQPQAAVPGVQRTAAPQVVPPPLAAPVAVAPVAAPTVPVLPAQPAAPPIAQAAPALQVEPQSVIPVTPTTYAASPDAVAVAQAAQVQVAPLTTPPAAPPAVLPQSQVTYAVAQSPQLAQAGVPLMAAVAPIATPIPTAAAMPQAEAPQVAQVLTPVVDAPAASAPFVPPVAMPPSQTPFVQAFANIPPPQTPPPAVSPPMQAPVHLPVADPFAPFKSSDTE